MTNQSFPDQFTDVPGALSYEEEAAIFQKMRELNSAIPPDAGLEPATSTSAAQPATVEPPHLTQADLFGASPNSALVIEDPAHAKVVQDALANPQENAPFLAALSSIASGQSSFEEEMVKARAASPEAAAPTSVQPATSESRKANQLDFQLAAIQGSFERERRFVIVGDENMKRAFYDHMAARGLGTNIGGNPILFCDAKRAMKELQKVSAELYPGTSAIHAAQVDIDRSGPGIGFLGKGAFQQASAMLANTFGKRHEVAVAVVGTPAQVDASLRDLGSVLSQVNEKGFIQPERRSVLDSVGSFLSGPEKGAAADVTMGKPGAESGSNSAAKMELPLVDGKIQLPESGPLRIRVHDSIDRFLLASKDVVANHNREVAAAKAERLSGSSNNADVARDNSKADSGAKSVSTEYATEKLTAIGQALSSDASVIANEKKGQTKGEVLFLQGTQINQSEIDALPKSFREESITNLAALTAKLRSGDFGKIVHASDVESRTSVVKSFLATESEFNPDFNEKSRDILNGLVVKGILTKEQADIVYQGNLEKIQLKSSAEATSESTSTPEKLRAGAADASSSGSSAASAQNTSGTNSASAAASQPGKSTVHIGGLDGRTETTSSGSARSDEAARSAPQHAQAAEHTGGQVGHSGTTSSGSARSDEAARSAPQHAQAAEHTGSQVSHSGTTSSGSARSESGFTQESGARATTGTNSFANYVALAMDPKSSRDADTVHGLLAGLDARKDKPLAELGAHSVEDKHRFVANVSALLSEASSGRHGSFAAAQAEGFASSVSKWKSELPTNTTTARAEAASAPNISSSTTASGSQTASVSERTLASLATIEQAMRNPAGSFTHRDKSWNVRSINNFTDAVLRLDAKEVATLSPEQRGAVASYAVWLADKANAGKLPGFDNEAGRVRAGHVTDKAVELINLVSSVELPSQVSRSLDKASAMVNAMDARSTELSQSSSAGNHVQSATSEASTSRPAATADMSSFAQDLVHAVYVSKSLSDREAMHFMMNGDKLSSAAMGTLSTADQARAVVALQELSSDIKKGLLGDFAALPERSQQAVERSSQTADSLHQQLSQTLGGRNALSAAEHAFMSGSPKDSGNHVDGLSPGAKSASSQHAPEAAKAAGRELDR